MARSNGSKGYFPANQLILDGKKWEQWCVKIGVIFGFQDVHDIVENGVPEEVVGGTVQMLKLQLTKIRKRRIARHCF